MRILFFFLKSSQLKHTTNFNWNISMLCLQSHTNRNIPLSHDITIPKTSCCPLWGSLTEKTLLGIFRILSISAVFPCRSLSTSGIYTEHEYSKCHALINTCRIFFFYINKSTVRMKLTSYRNSCCDVHFPLVQLISLDLLFVTSIPMFGYHRRNTCN